MGRERYITRQGEEILEIISLSESHLTADEICQLLKRDGRSVGKTTVYRHLKTLVDEGKVRKYNFENRIACYQLVSQNDCSSHFHLKCAACGALIHLSCSHLRHISSHIEEEHGFVIDISKTCFIGLCEKCRREKNETI